MIDSSLSPSMCLVKVSEDEDKSSESPAHPLDKIRARQPPTRKRLTMPYRISPLLSLMADVNGAQTMPSIFDSAVRKSSFFGKLCYDAPKVRKNLDTWDSLSRESGAYEEILRVVQ